MLDKYTEFFHHISPKLRQWAWSIWTWKGWGYRFILWRIKELLKTMGTHICVVAFSNTTFPVICHWHGVNQMDMKTTLVNIDHHDDVIKLKHFPRYWPFARGIHRSPVNSPHNDQWRGALVFSLICVWIKGWENNHDASDWRRYRTHYDVIVMY